MKVKMDCRCSLMGQGNRTTSFSNKWKVQHQYQMAALTIHQKHFGVIVSLIIPVLFSPTIEVIIS